MLGANCAVPDVYKLEDKNSTGEGRQIESIQNIVMFVDSFFFSGPVACNLFLLGASWNIHVLNEYNIEARRVIGLSASEWPNASDLWRCGVWGFVLLFHLSILYKLEYFTWLIDRPEIVVALYCWIMLVLLVCPIDIFRRKVRMTFWRTICRCIWPYAPNLQLPPKETPFLDVLVADGLTSLSKPFQDITIALMMTGCTINETTHISTHYKERFRSHPLPYLVASLPYLYVCNYVAPSTEL